jgi:hypothetical protein
MHDQQTAVVAVEASQFACIQGDANHRQSASLDVFEVLVGGDGACGVEGGGGDASADDVDPVDGCLGRDLLGVAAIGEAGADDLGDEVLGNGT